MERTPFGFSLLAALLLAGAARAQHPAPGAGQEERRVLPLRVADVVRLVHENAPAVRQAYLSALANSGSIEAAQGRFDPVVFADATFNYSESPTGGGFLSGGVAETKARSWTGNQGLRSTLITGASVELALSEAYNKNNQPSTFFGLNPRSTSGLSLRVTQPLLRGGWVLSSTADVRRAELTYDRGLATLRQTSSTTVQQAIDAYWSLAFAFEDVVVKEFSLDLAEELREVTLSKYRVGAVAEVEVVQTEADIASRQDALLTARNTVRQAQDALRTLILELEELEDWEVDLQPVSEPPEPASVELRWQDAFETAVRFRGDLRELRVDRERQRLEWELARKNMLPKLDLTASGSTSGLDGQILEALEPTFQADSPGYSIGLAFEIPFGNRGFRGAERNARVSYFLANRSLRDREHTVASEVRDAVRNVNFLAERVAVTVTARAVAERQLEAEQRRLREGASTNFQVLQFQRDLIEALTNEKNVRIEYAKSVSRLNTVQGLGWDGEVPELDPLEESYGPRDQPELR